MSTFVAIPADRLTAHLTGIGSQIQAVGGCAESKTEGSEIVYAFALPPSLSRSEFIVIKVYTSIGRGQEMARDRGTDAIRIVVGSIATGEFKPVDESVTLKRTAPNGIEDRVGAFLERLTEKLREAYAFGKGVPLCSCGHHMAKRQGGSGKFWGCTTFPVCRNTEKI